MVPILVLSCFAVQIYSLFQSSDSCRREHAKEKEYLEIAKSERNEWPQVVSATKIYVYIINNSNISIKIIIDSESSS